jgi:hypothetical protein
VKKYVVKIFRRMADGTPVSWYVGRDGRGTFAATSARQFPYHDAKRKAAGSGGVVLLAPEQEHAKCENTPNR